VFTVKRQIEPRHLCARVGKRQSRGVTNALSGPVTQTVLPEKSIS
jgi:hypothetical protein